MPRDLGDVFDYFLPPAEGDRLPTPHDSDAWGSPGLDPAGSPSIRSPYERTPDDRPAALPIVALPIGDREVVRAAYAWNLAVEVARRGASSLLVAPAGLDHSLLWPEPGTGPVGAEMVLAKAANLSELNRAALDIAVERAADANDGGVVFVRVPPAWLVDARAARGLLRWPLLFGTSDRRDLIETYGLAKTVLESHPDSRVGLTIHGVRRISEAEQAFRRVADVTARRLGQPLLSYGLLVDDLHVYRAIVARRPVGLEHPQSRAAKAIQDVARLLLEDAQKYAIA